ncbi:MAG: hypothetical protein ACETWM_20735 [Candidatus Lokiarchaeia archaeon]
MVSSTSNLINEALTFLKKIPGIRKIKVLSDVERSSLPQAELAAESAMVGCRSFNQGLREVLSREVVIVCSTDMDFEWPSGPHVILQQGEIIIGFITDNVDQVKPQFSEKIYVFGKNLVIFPERIRKLKGEKMTPTLFVYRGFKLDQLERQANVKNAVLAFCTRAGDAYLKALLKEEKKPELGSIVIGVDIS